MFTLLCAASVKAVKAAYNTDDYTRNYYHPRYTGFDSYDTYWGGTGWYGGYGDGYVGYVNNLYGNYDEDSYSGGSYGGDYGYGAYGSIYGDNYHGYGGNYNGYPGFYGGFYPRYGYGGYGYAPIFPSNRNYPRRDRRGYGRRLPSQ